MINEKTGQRELAYVVNIDEIRPIEGYDRVTMLREHKTKQSIHSHPGTSK